MPGAGDDGDGDGDAEDGDAEDGDIDDDDAGDDDGDAAADAAADADADDADDATGSARAHVEVDAPVSLDRRVVALGVARLADSFGNSLLIVVLPLYLASGAVGGWAFGLSTTVLTGLVLAAFGVFDSLIQPFAGWASDLTGRRRAFVLGGLAVLAATNAAFGAASTYLGAFAIRVVQGLGVGATVTASVALIDEYSTAADRGAHFGVFNALRLLGFGVGPVVGGVLVAGGPYRLAGRSVGGFAASFDVAALAAAVGLVIVAALVSDPDAVSAAASPDFSLAVFDAGGGLDPVFALGVATMFVAAGISLFAPVEPALNHRLSQGPRTFGLQFAAFVFAFVVTQPVVGRLSDRLGRKPFVVGGLVVVAPVLAAQGFVTASWQMTALRTVQGVGAAMAFGPALALAGDLATGGDSGTKLSVLTAAFGLGAGVSPVVAGPLVEIGFAVPFAVVGVLTLVGAAVVSAHVEETVGASAESATEEVGSAYFRFKTTQMFVGITLVVLIVIAAIFLLRQMEAAIRR